MSGRGTRPCCCEPIWRDSAWTLSLFQENRFRFREKREKHSLPTPHFPRASFSANGAGRRPHGGRVQRCAPRDSRVKASVHLSVRHDAERGLHPCDADRLHLSLYARRQVGVMLLKTIFSAKTFWVCPPFRDA